MFIKSHPFRSFALSLTFMLIAAGFAHAQSDITLAPGDTVSFSVLGAPNLSREATVGVDGRVYLPLVGQVAAAGLTTDDLRATLGALLRDRAYRVIGPNGEDTWRRLQEDELYVDIVSYRPVYVTGDVRSPGEVAYRPGLSVRQAMAIAGGVGRPIEENSEAQILATLTERSLIRGRIEAQLTTLERYKADLDAVIAAKGEAPAEGGDAAGIDSAPSSELEEVAQHWLEARADLRQLTETGNRLVLDRMQNRLTVLEDLEDASKQDLRFEEEEFERTLQLSERGLVPTSTLSEARRGLLQSSTRALETSGEVLRMRLDMTRFSEDTKANLTSQEISLLEEIAVGTARMRELKEQFEAVNRRLALLGATSVLDQEPSIVLSLFRATDPARSEEADPAMSMQPGDVLEVTLSLPDPTATMQ